MVCLWIVALESYVYIIIYFPCHDFVFFFVTVHHSCLFFSFFFFFFFCLTFYYYYTKMSLPDLPQPPELEVHIRPPPPEALHHDAPPEMLGVSPPEGQTVAQTRQTARATTGARYGVEGVGVAVAEIEQFFVAKGREAVGPYAGQGFRGNATAVVADADRDARERGGGDRIPWRGRRDRVEAYRSGRRGGGRVGRGCYCHFDRFTLLAALDRRSERVLEELREDVLEVRGDVGESGVRLAVDDDRGPDPVLQLADLRDEGFALADGFGGAERRVDDADRGRGAVLGTPVVAVAVRLR